MKKEVFKQIKHLCQPLVIKYFTKAIFVFGSSVTKKGNDIDVLVLFDDAAPNFEDRLDQLKAAIGRITKETKLKLHFQEPLKLSALWTLLIKGEPWIVTAVKNNIIVYDEANYVSFIKRLVKNKQPMGEKMKSERIATRAQETLEENRELLLLTIEQLFLATTEAAQIYLALKKKILFDPRKILGELKKEINIDAYFEILTLHEKSAKGALSEFTGEDLDYYTHKAEQFIHALEEVLLRSKQ